MIEHPIAILVTFVAIGIGCIVLGLKVLQGTGPLCPMTVVCGVFSILLGLGVGFWGMAKRKEFNDRQEEIAKAGYDEIDKLSGREFEHFLASVFKKQGYQVTVTRTSGDYGADLILQKGNQRIAIQAKHSINKIGVSAVQEIKTAMAHYNVHEGWVVTNNYFTQPAKNLAAENNIKLVDRYGLSTYINHKEAD